MKKVSFSALMALGLTAQVSSAATVFTENFAYADGALVTAIGSPWTTHSGTAGQVNVVSNAAELSFSESEDVNAPISPASTYYNDGVITLTMSATFSALPATANYFAHLKDATTSGFRGRIFATTTGAAAGTFRLGISNSSTSTLAFVETDLSLDTPIAISMVWNAALGTASLSVNGGAAVAAIDAANPLNISTVALRQSTNIGTMTIDNISVDATALPVPEPSTSLLGLLAGLGLMRRRR